MAKMVWHRTILHLFAGRLTCQALAFDRGSSLDRLLVRRCTDGFPSRFDGGQMLDARSGLVDWIRRAFQARCVGVNFAGGADEKIIYESVFG